VFIATLEVNFNYWA